MATQTLINHPDPNLSFVILFDATELRAGSCSRFLEFHEPLFNATLIYMGYMAFTIMRKKDILKRNDIPYCEY